MTGSRARTGKRTPETGHFVRRCNSGHLRRLEASAFTKHRGQWYATIVAVACVTGGGVRIGRAICLALGRAGFDVVVHANRSMDAAREVLRELAALGRQGWVERADFAHPYEVADLASRVCRQHPALDLLVNSAAHYEHRPFEEVPGDLLRQMITINLEAPFLLTQHLLPALRAARGAVVNITDMAVSHAYTPTHLFSHYLATKAALEQLTRSWALELGPEVRVNAVAPGPVAIAGVTTPAQRAEILARIPVGREGSPEDVADATVFLALAPYVTGQTLRVDGGLSVT